MHGRGGVTQGIAGEAALREARRAFAEGRYDVALDAARHALQLAPGAPEALAIAANAALAGHAFEQAVPWLEQLRLAQPGNAALARSLSMAHNNLGVQLRGAGRHEQAAHAFARALAVWADNREALYNHARALLDAGRPGDALAPLRRLRALAPDDVEAALELAEAEARAGTPAAILELRDALRGAAADPALDPVRVAHALIDAELPDLALQRLRSVDAVERIEVAAAAAEHLREQGFADHARSAWAHLAELGGHGRVAPSLRCAIGRRLALAPVHDDAAALAAERDRYARGLAELDAEFDAAALARCAPRLDQLMWVNFLLAYHGESDLELNRRYGALVERALRRIAPDLLSAPASAGGARRRVGLLSPGFRYCTVGSYFGSWIGALRAAGHETLAFALGPGLDATTEQLAASADRLVHLDGTLEAMAATVRDARLDLLLFPDVGMDARVAVLAALRLAPRQLAAWGHPDTTGLRSIDAFLSCGAMEPPDAASHYAERLLLLPGIGTAYARPPAPQRRSRAALGLPSGRLYLVPQAPFKIHPDNDAVIAELAARDGEARIVLFLDPGHGIGARLAARLARALRAAGADPARQLLFLPCTSRDAYLEICAACDVMLDTLHWSGGNTTIDALIAQLPVVTTPGRFMRGRQSMAMAQRLGLEAELVCAEPVELAARAVALATDRERLSVLRRRIGAGLDRFFDGRDALAALVGHVEAELARTPAP